MELENSTEKESSKKSASTDSFSAATIMRGAILLGAFIALFVAGAINTTSYWEGFVIYYIIFIVIVIIEIILLIKPIKKIASKTIQNILILVVFLLMPAFVSTYIASSSVFCSISCSNDRKSYDEGYMLGDEDRLAHRDHSCRDYPDDVSGCFCEGYNDGSNGNKNKYGDHYFQVN